MPRYEFRLTTVIQTLENDTHLAEALFFPEVSRFDTRRARVEESIKLNAVQMVEAGAPLDLHKRRFVAPPAIDEITFTLDPPPKSLAWREAVALRFQAVCFQQGDDAHIAYIPALGIEIIARNLDQLRDTFPAQIHAHLLRWKQAASLGELIWLQRARTLALADSTYTALLRTPKQIAASAEKEDDQKPVLEEVATDLTREQLRSAYQIDDLVTRLAEALVGRNPRSVLLVGPSGVGKTAAAHELVRRRDAHQLGRTPFYATSGSRLVAGMSGYGMWQERCGRMWREASAQKAILHLGNLLELMEVGKSEASGQGIAGYFRPYISRGDLLVIAECTPEQLPLIERSDPHLLDAFLQIKVEEPSGEKGRAILLSVASEAATIQDSPIEPDGLEMLDRLHRRYATYSAYPGRPLRFLKNLLEDRDGKTITGDDVTARFSEETGLPLFLLNDAVKLDLGDARAWFGKQVIGQMEAVALIIDLLATVKARLTRAGRPIASLMFIGPTGVGKTEMAKALAEFLFQSRDRMIRFDMSEYADPIAVDRLIGGIWGAEGLLTAKVREQPFAVILLDEFEKAHPSFFDLLLQVLGEGRLTDSSGRLADFTNAVVIMTSNLGAETFKRSALGFRDGASAAGAAREHFLKEVRAFVRPEFFNRIDRIVPFAPLDEATVLHIARRELEQLTKRDGILYRGVALDVGDEVARYLGGKGYDARYGARPLKRALERELLAPLAESLNKQSAEVALQADARIEAGQLVVAAWARADAAGRPLPLRAGAGVAELAARAAQLRRAVQSLERSPAVAEIHNEIFQLMRLEKQLARRTWKSAENLERLARLPGLGRGAKRLRTLAARVASLEDEALLALYDKAPCDEARLAEVLAAAVNEWERTLLAIYALQFKDADRVTIAVYGENTKWLFALAQAYYEIASLAGNEAEVAEFAARTVEESAAMAQKKPKQQPRELLGRAVTMQAVSKPREFFAAPASGVVGIALSVRGELAYPRFESECGLHDFTEQKQHHRCLVHASEATLAEYKRPAGIEKRGSIAHQEKRRTYYSETGVIEDEVLEETFYFQGGRINEPLRYSIEHRVMQAARELLEP